MFVHEEICHRQIKKPRYRVESHGADTVHALFIFLNLLKAYTDGFSESLLRDALGETCGPHPATDMNVHDVGTSSERRVDSLILRRYKPGTPRL